MRTLSHLSFVGNGHLVAWHKREDVQAIVFPGETESVLFVDGKRVNLCPISHPTAVRSLINYCKASAAAQKRMREYWNTL